MSSSLMLALLEPQYQGDADYTSDFSQLGDAQRRLLFAALYNSLYSHIGREMASPIGTILARAISGDQAKDSEGHTPRFYADTLRHVLRGEMIQQLDALMACQDQENPST